MSIIIKGLDMPTCSNEDCVVVIRKGKAEVWQTGFKERTLEAIQIPTPHGRLIDGDLVADMLDSMMAHGTLNRAYDEVMDAPTIIEAEE